MERRKTTTENKLYATLDDHYKMMFGIAPDEVVEERPQPSRPVSWHPSSSQFQAPRQMNHFDCPTQQTWSNQYSPSRTSNHGSDFYSLSARNSMLEPIAGAPDYATSCSNHRGSDESHYSWQSAAQQTQGYAHSAANTPTTEPLPWYLQQWAQKNQAYAAENQSNDFLPIQRHSDQDIEMEEEEEGEKLVALGLYDSPEPSLSWGGLVEATGKGLKLEETWQPPENDEDEDNEEEEEEGDDAGADDASSEASVEEPSPPLPAVHQHSQQLAMPMNMKAQASGNMEGQSFFFDEDESVGKEWWYHQLKQPSMPVRDTELGYDWL